MSDKYSVNSAVLDSLQFYSLVESKKDYVFVSEAALKAALSEQSDDVYTREEFETAINILASEGKINFVKDNGEPYYCLSSEYRRLHSPH